MDEAKKQEWLAHISRALGRESVPETIVPYDYSEGPQFKMMQHMSQDDIIARFKVECDNVGTKYVEANSENLAQVVLDVVRSHNGGKVICPDVLEMEMYGIREALENAASEGIVYLKWDAALGRDANITAIEDASIGITFPILGIAATATIIQPSYKESGRAVGLLPLTHVAIIRKSDIMPRMTQTMAKLGEIYRQDPENFPTNVCHISGPSNTADIELVRVVGVHGPINVTFILLDA